MAELDKQVLALAGAVRPESRPQSQDLAALGRRAAAGRNPQDALPRRRSAHHGRADRRADAAGGRRAVRHPALMVAQGHSIVFISHKLDEVLAIANRVTVLRHGKVTAAGRARHGRDASATGATDGRPRGGLPIDKKPVQPGEVVLLVEGIVRGERPRPARAPRFLPPGARR